VVTRRKMPKHKRNLEALAELVHVQRVHGRLAACACSIQSLPTHPTHPPHTGGASGPGRPGLTALRRGCTRVPTGPRAAPLRAG
jgi:hypothetical protein